MNILDIELEYSRVFNIIPNAYIVLGKSIWLRFSWLNFELAIKHISCDYKAKCLRLHTPSATLNSYPNSGYSATLEICAFGYVYRKGLFRIKNRDIQPTDNTNGFVPSDWFNQFRTSNIDPFSDLIDFIKKMKDEMNHDN